MAAPGASWWLPARGVFYGICWQWVHVWDALAPPEGEVYSLEDLVHCVWCGRRLVATHAPVAVRKHARTMVFCSLQCAENGTQALSVPGFGNASIR
jgi:hypothetical protein